PPLFIWSLVPVLPLFTDPLFAARTVSVGIGLAQMWVIWKSIRVASRDTSALLAAVAIVLLTPFWFFHQRMALMDGLLTLGLSLSLLGFLLLDRVRWPTRWNIQALQHVLGPIVLTGFGWAIALWTKTPALFFAPVFVIWALLPPQLSKKTNTL